MRRLPVYVETGVAMADDRAAAAWTFEPNLWGRCGQGHDEESAVGALCQGLGTDVDPIVVERTTGDEQAFQRDLQPASDTERQVTLAILAAARDETLALVTSSSPSVLDFDDPTRTLPAWARWRTLRQVAWHLADTESRYYLPALGLPIRSAEPDLTTELTTSARHVRTVVSTMPATIIRRTPTEVWTTTKVLRRLAWHERSELITMHHLAHRARTGWHGRLPLNPRPERQIRTFSTSSWPTQAVPYSHRRHARRASAVIEESDFQNLAPSSPKGQ